MRRLMVAAAVAACSCGAFAAIRAVTPAEKGVERHALKMKAITNDPPKVVFLGDSITHFWEVPGRGKGVWDKFFAEGPQKALCLGTSGDRTENVLWRIENGELDGYEAKCIVLMIGTNNTGHFKRAEEPPINTILGVRAVLKAIRLKQPKAMIVLHPIFPRGRSATDEGRRRNAIVNKEIQRFADGKTIFWCDFSEQFLTADGELLHEIFPDFLHPESYGYEVWAAAVRPYIAYALSDGRLPDPGNRYTSRPRKEDFRRFSDCMAEYPLSCIWGLDTWWVNRLQEKQDAIADVKGGAFDLVMMGDSITHNWDNRKVPAFDEYRKTHNVLNLGFGGDRTDHLLWRLQNGELDGYTAKTFTLMIGTNASSVPGMPPDHIARATKKIIDLVFEKHPEAERLILHPIFPRGASADDMARQKNEAVNKLIREFADGKKVVWCDFNAKLVDEKGDTQFIMPDRLHPNDAGHGIWWNEIKGLVGE